jgi:nicotinamidase-related amidase
LLLVDVLNDFEHEDGDALLASFRERQPCLRQALERARADDVPVAYAQDTHGVWSGDRAALVRRALRGRGGDLVEPVAPREDDVFVVKPRYSAFDLTPLELILGDLDVERILLAGMATEMCVAQTAIAARERGFKVTVLADACAAVDPHDERIALEYLERVVGVFVESTGRLAGRAQG